MAIDLRITADGELMIGPNGDLDVVWGDEQVAQEVMFRLKTTRGDWLLAPQIGCSLEEYIGQPNNSFTHALIQSRIEDSLTADNLLFSPDIFVVALNENEVFILIEFNSLDSDDRIIQVQGQLDLRKGLVFSRIATREMA